MASKPFSNECCRSHVSRGTGAAASGTNSAAQVRSAAVYMCARGHLKAERCALSFPQAMPRNAVITATSAGGTGALGDSLVSRAALFGDS
jgi:hypothetical protein